MKNSPAATVRETQPDSALRRAPKSLFGTLGLAALLAAIALWGVRRESAVFWLAAALGVCVLIVLAVRLGVLRQGGETSVPQNTSRMMNKETAGSD